MSAMLHLIKFSSKQTYSYSVLIDSQQIYVRNIVLFCTGLSMVRLLFGDVIHCQNNSHIISQTYVDTFCYINGTITKNGAILYHDYYQWVSVYLLLLGFGFHFPYSIWSKNYGRYIRHLESLAEKPDEAIHLIEQSNGYCLFLKTLALEFFYSFYLVLLLTLTNLFFNRLWSRLSWSWKAVYVIFPNNGICYIDYYTSSGLSTGRFLCLLPLCSIYRKVFLFLYLLTIVLIAETIFIVAYRVILLLVKRKRINVWWALTVVNCCSVSWYTKRRVQLAWKSMLLENVDGIV